MESENNLPIRYKGIYYKFIPKKTVRDQYDKWKLWNNDNTFTFSFSADIYSLDQCIEIVLGILKTINDEFR